MWTRSCQYSWPTWQWKAGFRDRWQHQKQVDEVIKHDCRITQKQTEGRLGMSKESGIYHWFTWLRKSLFSMPRMLTPEKKQKTCWNLWRTFEALSRRGRSISFQYCYWGWVMDSFWPWRKTTEHAIQANFISSPEKTQKCRLPARFFWLFFGSQRVYDRIFGGWEHCQFSLVHWNNKKNLQRRVCRVRRSTSPILLLHDNVRPHTTRATIDALETLKFEVLSHPPYSPDLAPSDFHFFPHLKRDLKGTHFTSDDEVKQAVTS